MRQTVRAQLNQMEDRYPGTKKRIFNAWLEMGKKMKEKGGWKEGEEGRNALQSCKTCGEPSSAGECAACRMKREIGKKKVRLRAKS